MAEVRTASSRTKPESLVINAPVARQEMRVLHPACHDIPFDEYLIELGARALCFKNESGHSPDDLQVVLPENIDMRRKKYPSGEPYWMKYRDDARTVIDAIFNRTKTV